MEQLKLIIDKYKMENEELKKYKKDYELQSSVLTDFIQSLDCESLEDIKETYLEMEKYLIKINNYGIKSCDDLYSKLDHYFKIMKLLKNNNIDDLNIYINKTKDIKYLSHDDLLNNNYYSQMINTNYILTEQLKNKTKQYDYIYMEVTYFRNMYMNDDVQRKKNYLLDSDESTDNINTIQFDKIKLLEKENEDLLYKINKLELNFNEKENTPINNYSYITEIVNKNLHSDIIYKIIYEKRKTKKCNNNTCIKFIPNKFNLCYYHLVEKKKSNIINNTMIYNLKINIKNIPVIVEHHKYEQTNPKDCQLVHYYDINKHYKDLLLLFNKYNLSFNNKKRKQKDLNTPKRNNYGQIDQVAEINKILDKLVKSRKIGSRRYPDNINIKLNRYKLESYNDYYINSNKYDEDEKQLFFEQENIKYNTINKSRFEKYTRIFHKLHNDEIIRNSEYVFLPNTFKNINLKSIDNLIYKIRQLCKDKYSLEEIKNNHFLKDDEVEHFEDNEVI